MVNSIVAVAANETPTITGAVSNITTMAEGVMSLISGNELLFTLWGASLFFIGVGVVKSLKGAAKR